MLGVPLSDLGWIGTEIFQLPPPHGKSQWGVPLEDGDLVDWFKGKCVGNHGCPMKYLGGPIHDGTLKWMVYFMENPTKMDENRGYPHLYETSIWKNHW